MNNKPYMDALVELAVFLDLSGSETVDEDAAIRVMESLAATLRKLGPAETTQFLDYLKHRALQAKSEQDRQVLASFASNLGLAAE